MNEAWDDLLRVLQPRWPQEWRDDTETLMALTQLEDDARRGLPSSLPVVQSASRISWLSVAASRRELRDILMTRGPGFRKPTPLSLVEG